MDEVEIDPQAILVTMVRAGEDEATSTVRMESAEQVFGLQTGNDYSTLRGFVRRAAEGDSRALGCLFAPMMEFPSVDALASDLGHELRALSDAFVGRHLVGEYRYQVRTYAEAVIRENWDMCDRIATHGYDTDAALSAAWFGFRGVELLRDRRLTIPMVGDQAEWLADLRAGKVPFDEWWEEVTVADSVLEALGEDERIPEGPDVGAIEAWVVSAYRRWWGWD